MFKRAHKPPLSDRVLNFFWPRIGLKRSIKYLGWRLLRLKASSHSIAAGIASGVAVSFTPFLGLHILLAFLVAFFTRGHFLASVIGTFVGNPWTFPLFFAATGSLGSALSGDTVSGDLAALAWGPLLDDPFGYLAGLLPIIEPYMIGAIPIGSSAWIISYLITKNLIERNRGRKAKKAQGANDQVLS